MAHLCLFATPSVPTSKYVTLVGWLDWSHGISSLHIWCTGFPELISPKAKASKTLFRPIKPTIPFVQKAYIGQSSFGITGCSINRLRTSM